MTFFALALNRPMVLMYSFRPSSPSARICSGVLAFGHPTIAVDIHIFRVSNRTGIAPGKNVVEVEKKLLKFVPNEFKLDAHHWLILHGRYTCIARKPRCASCLIEDLCEFKQKNID